MKINIVEILTFDWRCRMFGLLESSRNVCKGGNETMSRKRMSPTEYLSALSQLPHRRVKITQTGNCTLQDVEGVCMGIIEHSYTTDIHFKNGRCVNVQTATVTASGDGTLHAKPAPGIPGNVTIGLA